jgi:hypothetical protein
MLHPNNKLQTRLQLIKRLFNTPNYELIYKTIFTSDNSSYNLASNSKLMIYLNILIEQQQKNSDKMSNNDKEILNHLNEMFNLSFLSATKLNSSKNYLNKLNNSVDLTNFDKEFDDEMLKIYTKSKIIFKQFIKIFDIFSRIIDGKSFIDYITELNTNLFNNCMCDVLKSYFQYIKSRHDQTVELKHKWLEILENMTHEHCLWFDPLNAQHFTVLDQTEGPNRERRRLKKSHLYIKHKFFKNEVHNKVDCEKRASKYEYLLCNEDDYATSSNKSNMSSIEPTDGSYVIEDSSSHYFRNTIFLQYVKFIHFFLEYFNT